MNSAHMSHSATGRGVVRRQVAAVGFSSAGTVASALNDAYDQRQALSRPAVRQDTDLAVITGGASTALALGSGGCGTGVRFATVPPRRPRGSGSCLLTLFRSFRRPCH